MEENLNFVPLLLVLLLAFIVPMLLGRIRWLPVVVGEILAGVLIGHSGLNLVNESAVLATNGENNKRSVVGTISYMPPVFGCYCASVVINDLVS